MVKRDLGQGPTWWDADFLDLGLSPPVYDEGALTLSETEHVRLARELEAMGRQDLMGVLNVVRGDEALALGQVDTASHAYQRALPSLRNSQRATEYLRAVVGLAELTALAGRWEAFNAIVGQAVDRVEGEGDPAVRARAQGVLHVKSALLGTERNVGEWRAALALVETSGDFDGAWRMSQTLAMALEGAGTLPAAIELFESSQVFAKTAGRDILLSQSILCHARILFRAGRHPECDDLVPQALEASRRADDLQGIDRVLALGCDVAVALGQPNLLLQRSLERSRVAQERGEGELSRKLVRQALTTALRTGSTQSLEIGRQLASLSSPDGAFDPGAVEIGEVIDDITAVGLAEDARDLALAWARYRFGSGWKREAAILLLKSAALTRQMDDPALAMEMHDEAVAIAEMYGLEELEQWRTQREKLIEET
jgi:tetratricopeptide (TPR) repeat protein